MKEFVEKLIKTFKCEELRTELIAVGDVISIVNQLAEEHKECFKMCSKDCEVYDKEKHYCPKWCKLIRETVEELKEEYNQDSTKNNQGWILCSERLPEDEGRYLTTAKFNNGTIESFDLFLTDGKWLVDEDDEEFCGEVIAWRKLLEPYKVCEVRQDLDKLSQEPKTRIDHIRSMSVEEMADAILERSEISTAIDFCQNFEECEKIIDKGENISDEMCKKCMIKYLNSPVE